MELGGKGGQLLGILASYSFVPKNPYEKFSKDSGYPQILSSFNPNGPLKFSNLFGFNKNLFEISKNMFKLKKKSFNFLIFSPVIFFLKRIIKLERKKI